MGKDTAVITPEPDVKNQELKKELAELDDNPSPSVLDEPVKPVDTVTPPVQVLDKPADDTSVKKYAVVVPDVKAEEPVIDYKAEFEKVKNHKDNLEKALHEMRLKRKDDLSRLAALQSSNPAADDAGKIDRDIDPEVENIIKSTIEPELNEVRTEIRLGRFQQDATRVITKEGAEKYKTAMDTFNEIITPESHLYDPSIHEAFMKSKAPAEFAFKIGMSMGLDGYIESIRKETAEKVKKETLEELKNSANKTIPSLSQLNGGKPANAQPNSLRKEMDDL